MFAPKTVSVIRDKDLILELKYTLRVDTKEALGVLLNLDIRN